MAQWIARRTSNPEAVGSSPTGDVYAFEGNVVWFQITIQIRASCIEKCLAIQYHT